MNRRCLGWEDLSEQVRPALRPEWQEAASQERVWGKCVPGRGDSKVLLRTKLGFLLRQGCPPLKSGGHKAGEDRVPQSRLGKAALLKGRAGERQTAIKPRPISTCRASEEAFVKESKEETPGTEWEKVAQLCDFNPKSSKQCKDVSRLRSVLMSLKQTPLSR